MMHRSLVTKNLEIQLPIKLWKSLRENLNAAFFSSITLAPSSSYQHILFMLSNRAEKSLVRNWPLYGGKMGISTTKTLEPPF